MTSREHARRLMLILLSSTRSQDPKDTADDEGNSGHDDEDRQEPDARHDSIDKDEQNDEERLQALILT
jgi:hypothetical protein